MIIRKASTKDVDSVEKIYSLIHDLEEKNITTIGWKREIYPTLKTALMAVERDDLFVMEENGKIVASAIINQNQVPEYKDCNWGFDASPDEVMVLHTLVVSPESSNMGYGKAFVKFYEDYALENGCRYLRMDTNEKNLRAREIYKKLGYKEPQIVDCCFNGIEGVRLVCLEKKL